MSCNFCDEQLPYNTKYGAIWLDKTDKIGNLKWTSKQCPPFAECSTKEMNIANTIKINYCPICGKKIDH